MSAICLAAGAGRAERLTGVRPWADVQATVPRVGLDLRMADEPDGWRLRTSSAATCAWAHEPRCCAYPRPAPHESPGCGAGPAGPRRVQLAPPAIRSHPPCVAVRQPKNKSRHTW